MERKIYCVDSGPHERVMCPICKNTHIPIYNLYVGIQIVGACEKCLKEIRKSIKLKLDQINRDKSLPRDYKRGKGKLFKE